MTDYRRLGRIEHHDPRNRGFVAPTAPALKTVTHRIPPLARRLDQGNLGSCEGNGTVQVLNTKPFHATRTRFYDERDAIRVYALATQLDQWEGQYPPDDNGTSNVAAAKAAQRLGMISSYHWAFGFESVLGALVLQPLLAGMPWFEGMFHPDGDGFIRVGGGKVGGHAFCLFGLNMRHGYVWMLNSWANWGSGQRAKISFDDLKILLAEGGEVTAFDV